MYRCAASVFAAAVAVCAAAPAPLQAQGLARNFPPNALRGTLAVQSPDVVSVNGRPVQFAPGVRVRGQNNTLLLTGSLSGSQLVVNYTVDTQGAVNSVWILTATEAARQPWPTTIEQAKTWRFDQAEQVWTKP